MSWDDGSQKQGLLLSFIIKWYYSICMRFFHIFCYINLQTCVQRVFTVVFWRKAFWFKAFNIKTCCGALVWALCLCHHCPTILSLSDCPGLHLAVIPDFQSDLRSVFPTLTLQLWLPDALQQRALPLEQLHLCLGDHRRLGSHRWSWAGGVSVSAVLTTDVSPSLPSADPKQIPSSTRHNLFLRQSGKISNHRAFLTWSQKRCCVHLSTIFSFYAF